MGILANPPRFAFTESTALPRSVWADTRQRLKIDALCPLNEVTFAELPDKDLFRIELLIAEE
jgi:hypothetical protein